LPAGGSCLVVAGSRHPATRDQIAALEGAGITGVRVERGGGASTRGITERLREGGAAFIASVEALDGAREEMAAQLAAAASTVLAEIGPALLVLTGGDTALAVLRALGARRLELVGAPASGLALGRIVLDGRPPLTVLTKAGGFGAPELLASLATGAIR
jgi:D-threonate/D-erythronate kinase